MEEDNDNKTFIITCTHCHEEYPVKVNRDGYFKWRSGVMIQDALPELNADERELMVSRTCSGCWDRIFS